jgi:phenylacetate-CoA ligase
LEGFPSTILVLAKFLKRNEATCPINAVFTSSEPLFDLHRQEMERSFGADVFDHYGQAERVAAASDCPEHRGLHVHPEYGVLELVKGGSRVSTGERGEIVGTGLNNLAMPLIRYRTGDIAELSGDKCPCGRGLPLLKAVDGRKADCIVTPEGRVIPGGGLMGAFHGIGNIRTSQIIQDEPERLTVKIVRDCVDEVVDTTGLVANLKRCVGDRITIEIDEVESISGREGVKHRWVISKVDSGM